MESSLSECVRSRLRAETPGARVLRLSPAREGMNMGGWLGFRHVSYLVEYALYLYL